MCVLFSLVVVIIASAVLPIYKTLFCNVGLICLLIFQNHNYAQFISNMFINTDMGEYKYSLFYFHSMLENSELTMT